MCAALVRRSSSSASLAFGPVDRVHKGPVLVLTGMGTEIAAAKVLDVLLGVTHGCLNGGMAEKLLDVAKVSAVGEEMGSTGVP